MNLTTTIVLGTGLILVGCDQLPMGKSKIQCNDENSKTLVKEIVVEQLQHKTSASVKNLSVTDLSLFFIGNSSSFDLERK